MFLLSVWEEVVLPVLAGREESERSRFKQKRGFICLYFSTAEDDVCSRLNWSVDLHLKTT